METKKMIFLILHYKNINETIECIDSINNVIEYKNKSIIVVDNGSKNGTFEMLKNKYKQENIYIIKTDENLGFARGNNFGFVFAKKNLDPDFIIMINSDVILIQKDFCQKIINEFEKERFDILGPDILNMNQTIHSNPNKVNFNNKKDIKKRIKKLKEHLFFCKYRLEYLFLVKNKIKSKLFKNRRLQWDIKRNTEMELHGACLIFSKDYIKKYNGLNEKTFLYYEESFLYYISKRDQLSMIYSPELRIIHNESKSTKSIYKNIIKRKEFYYENALNSCEKLLELVEKDKYWE